jgi:hypothetical protein
MQNFYGLATKIHRIVLTGLHKQKQQILEMKTLDIHLDSVPGAGSKVVLAGEAVELPLTQHLSGKKLRSCR